MELRPYQLDAIQSVKRCFDKGYDSALSIVFTGGGKTVLASNVIKNVAPISEKRTLFLVSWQDLVYQTRRAFIRYEPTWGERRWTREGRPGIGIVMGNTNQPDGRVIIGTPQTLGGSEKKPDLTRLIEVLSYGKIDLIVIDEAHRSVTKQFIRILEAIKADNPNVKIAGYTATPWREDGLGLNNIFDVIACNYNLQYAIMNNYACKIRDPLQIETHVHINESADSDEEIANAIDVENWAEIVLKGYLENGENRLSLAFMPSVEHSRQFAKYAQSQGIECAHVDSDGCIMPNGQAMGTKQRHAIYEWFSSEKSPNRPRILTNYNILTTGFDCPPISCLIWSRPTKSDLIFMQALGRGTRLDPSKEDLLLLDYVVEDLKLISVSQIVGLALESTGETAEKEEEQLAEGTDTRDAAAKKGETYVSGKGVVVKIGKLIGHSKNSWYSNPHDNTMSLACGDSHILFVVPPFYTLAKRIEEGLAEGEQALEKKPDSEKFKAAYQALDAAYYVFNNYSVWKLSRVNDRWQLFERPIFVDDNPMSLMDRMAPLEDQLMGDNAILSKKHKAWRRKPASPKQLELLRRLQCFDTPESMGRAAQMITHHMAAPRIEKKIEEMRSACKVYGILDSELKALGEKSA